MPSKILTHQKLKQALEEASVGKTLSDGDSLRGIVSKNRAGAIYINFQYKYRDGKKWRTSKVGHWPTSTLAQIRSIHEAMKVERSKGIDPIDSRHEKIVATQLAKAQREETYKAELNRIATEEAQKRTFGEALAKWARQELSRRKDNGKEALRGLTKDVIPKLGNVALVDIKRSMLIDILDDVVNRGANVMANHLLSDLKQFFTFAITREWIEAHPLIGIKKEKIGGRQKERDRYLSEEEILELKRNLPNAKLLRSTELSIWIMLSTCCRIGELAQAKWFDIDLEKSIWTIPAKNSKNAKTHIVYLSRFSLTQFKELQAITGQSEWCLPSRDGAKNIDPKSITKQITDRVKTSHLTGRSKASGTLLLKNGKWTPHDLRRTAATLMGELGVYPNVIERCLNHIEQNKLVRIYQRQEMKDEKIDAWNILGNKLETLVL